MAKAAEALRYLQRPLIQLPVLKLSVVPVSEGSMNVMAFLAWSLALSRSPLRV